jgi:hypothetical protein
MERRREPRWKASSNKHRAQVLSGYGSWTTATIVDISRSGIGLRIEGYRSKIGTRVRIKIDILGEVFEVWGIVKSTVAFSPRVGFQIESVDVMERIVQKAETAGFLMAEVADDTLVIKGSVTLASAHTLHTIQGHRKIDHSGVTEISIGGAHHIFKILKSGVKITSCSEPVAPRFASMGICLGARLCVADVPFDLPKGWPLRNEFLARRSPLVIPGADDYFADQEPG